MFGRKNNQIKALKQELQIKDRTLADRHQLLTIRNDELETLKSENQGLKARVEELENGLKFANQTNVELNRQIGALNNHQPKPPDETTEEAPQ